MIVSQAHDFGFVHIPKCAGSSVRQQLRDIDDLDQRFFGTIDHPALGKINGNHLPLWVLEAHYPDDLAKLRAVTTYAVVREPLDRFVSSVAQFLRAKGLEPGTLSPSDIREEVAAIIAVLSKDEPMPHIHYAVFLKQIDYVDLHGVRVIDHIYPMDRVDQLMAQLGRDHDLSLATNATWNPTVTYRFPALTGLLKRAKTVAQRFLPHRTYAQVRDLALAAFATKGAPNLEDLIREDSQIVTFVGQYYAADQALYAAILSAQETSKT